MRLAKNIGGEVKMIKGINGSNQTAATVNGTGIDRMTLEAQDGYMSCIVLAGCGAASGSPSAQSVAWKLQDSADNSTFADVSGATITTQTADNSSGSMSVDLSTLRRYIRVSTTVGFTGGTSPAIPIWAVVCLGGALYLPPA